MSLLTQGVGRKAIYTFYLRPGVTAAPSSDVSALTFPLPTEGDSGSNSDFFLGGNQARERDDVGRSEHHDRD